MHYLLAFTLATSSQYGIPAHSVAAIILAAFQQIQATARHMQEGIYPLWPYAKPADDNRAH
jgi:hypothetical protein